MDIDIIVQDIAGFRIHPAVLRRPDRWLAWVGSRAKADGLDELGGSMVFDEIEVLDTLEVQDLVGAVRRVRDRLDPGETGTVRLLCHDEYALSRVATVREELGLTGAVTRDLAAFSDKLAMKAALAGSGVRMPRHVAWDEEAYRADTVGYVADVLAKTGLPACAKPTNESGSVGVRMLHTVDDAHHWAAHHDLGCAWEVDEFVQGTLFHVDTLVRQGRTLHVGVNQNVHPCLDYVHGKISCSFTVPTTHVRHDDLCAFSAQVLAAIENKPQEGMFHLEVFETSAGELVFLEVAARAPAALIPFTSALRYGVNVEEAHFRVQRGEDVPVPGPVGPYAGYVYFPKRRGQVADRARVPLESDHRWTWNVGIGEEMTAPQDIRDFACSVLLWNEDFEALQRDLKTLDASDVLVTIDEVGA